MAVGALIVGNDGIVLPLPLHAPRKTTGAKSNPEKRPNRMGAHLTKKWG